MNLKTVRGLDIDINISINGKHAVGYKTMVNNQFHIPTFMLENYIRGCLTQLASGLELDVNTLLNDQIEEFEGA